MSTLVGVLCNSLTIIKYEPHQYFYAFYGPVLVSIVVDMNDDFNIARHAEYIC